MDMDELTSPTDVSATAGANRRVRPAATKTFQCRGYGDCTMVFSRSEHLARHIRKHTGERPFSCHCGKQFSRLDNLRQHAQTVHAERSDDNELMMRELSSLHATISAAAKGSRSAAVTTSRRSAQVAPAQPSADGLLAPPGLPSPTVKQEDAADVSLYRHHQHHHHQRPGTSTGHEGGADHAYDYFRRPASQRSWPMPPPADAGLADGGGGPGQHSFRPFSSSNSTGLERVGSTGRALHSFRPASRSPPPASAPGSTSHFHFESRALDGGHGHSVQPFAGPSSFTVSEQLPPLGPPRIRDGSGGSSRPSTGTERTLPPLAAVFAPAVPGGLFGPSRSATGSSSLGFPASTTTPTIASAQSGDRVLPVPNPSVRPGSGYGGTSRPGTAPAGFAGPAWPALDGRLARPGLVHRGTDVQHVHARPDTGGLGLGRLGAYAGVYDGANGLPPLAGGLAALGALDGELSDSPFSFQPPPLAAEQPERLGAYNPRKRPLPGWDDDDERPRTRGGSSRPPTGYGAPEYDYGTGSRPQSRRISVMDLIADEPGDTADAGHRGSLLSASSSYASSARSAGVPADAYGDQARPVTSSSITLGASALRIRDDDPSRPPSSRGGGSGRVFGPARGAPAASDEPGAGPGPGLPYPFAAGVHHAHGYSPGRGGPELSAAHGHAVRRLSGGPAAGVHGGVRHGSPAAGSPAAWSSASSDSLASPASASARGSASPASPVSPRFGWPGPSASVVERERAVWGDGSAVGAGRRDGDARGLFRAGRGHASAAGPGLPPARPPSVPSRGGSADSAAAWERATSPCSVQHSPGPVHGHGHGHGHGHPASPPLTRMSA